MKKFEYIIKDEIGLHARPAGMLVKEAKKFQSKIVINKDGKKADATRLMAVMGLSVKNGQKIEIEVSGSDEEVACEAMKEFFEKNV